MFFIFVIIPGSLFIYSYLNKKKVYFLYDYSKIRGYDFLNSDELHDFKNKKLFLIPKNYMEEIKNIISCNFMERSKANFLFKLNYNHCDIYIFNLKYASKNINNNSVFSYRSFVINFTDTVNYPPFKLYTKNSLTFILPEGINFNNKLFSDKYIVIGGENNNEEVRNFLINKLDYLEKFSFNGYLEINNNALIYYEYKSFPNKEKDLDSFVKKAKDLIDIFNY